MTNNEPTLETMLTVEEVAAIFNVSPRTILRLIDAHEIQALRVGRQWRFRKEWVKEWIEQHTSHHQQKFG
ncbi:helix-turn-helix domain-containing protein [bacterium]|nr:helix-turn-helix domain-containing protein [bacterium]